MRFKMLIVVSASIALVTGCSSAGKVQDGQEKTKEVENVIKEEKVGEVRGEEVKGESSQYPIEADVRSLPGLEIKEISEKGLSKELISSYRYNEATDFKSFEKVANEIMEEGKNPGLGVRGLHQKGITGEGVNVAIIDQPIELNHPEYKGKIVEYKNLCSDEGEESSMHGPAVASLLAGDTIGVAPKVNIYYAAAPSWSGDAAYYAEALKWIIECNKALPKEKGIHVVSVSAAPSGEGSPFSKNNKQWDEAVKLASAEGILVLDCTTTYGTIGACYYAGKDREDGKTYIAGFSREDVLFMVDPSRILAPVGYRTTAETYEKGSYSYQYSGRGGLSWGIPYAAGTLALGWQIDSALTSEEAMTLLDETASFNQEGHKIINPVAFVEAVQARLNN